MPTPITWRNMQAPSFGAANSLISSGVDKLGNSFANTKRIGEQYRKDAEELKLEGQQTSALRALQAIETERGRNVTTPSNAVDIMGSDGKVISNQATVSIPHDYTDALTGVADMGVAGYEVIKAAGVARERDKDDKSRILTDKLTDQKYDHNDITLGMDRITRGKTDKQLDQDYKIGTQTYKQQAKVNKNYGEDREITNDNTIADTNSKNRANVAGPDGGGGTEASINADAFVQFQNRMMTPLSEIDGVEHLGPDGKPSGFTLMDRYMSGPKKNYQIFLAQYGPKVSKLGLEMYTDLQDRKPPKVGNNAEDNKNTITALVGSKDADDRNFGAEIKSMTTRIDKINSSIGAYNASAKADALAWVLGQKREHDTSYMGMGVPFVGTDNSDFMGKGLEMLYRNRLADIAYAEMSPGEKLRVGTEDLKSAAKRAQNQQTDAEKETHKFDASSLRGNTR